MPCLIRHPCSRIRCCKQIQQQRPNLGKETYNVANAWHRRKYVHQRCRINATTVTVTNTEAASLTSRCRCRPRNALHGESYKRLAPPRNTRNKQHLQSTQTNVNRYRDNAPACEWMPAVLRDALVVLLAAMGLAVEQRQLHVGTVTCVTDTLRRKNKRVGQESGICG